MSKLLSFKTILISSLVTIIIVGSIALYLFKNKQTISPLSEDTTTVVLEKLPSKTLKEYVDDSGFSFNYPEDVVISKKEINDDDTYTNLELTAKDIRRSILIKITETQLKSIDDWFLENKLATPIKDVEFGGLSGKEAKALDKLTAVALDQGVLFTIELNSADEYWLSVYNTTLSSFAFVQTQVEPVADSASPDFAEGDVILEEEVIE